MRWLGPLAAIAACHAEENRQLRTHVDYAPLAAKNGAIMYANARGPPKPWSRATVTAASSNHFRTLVNFVHNYRKQRSGIPLHVYDLGLLPREVRTLRKQAGVVYHAFNFSNEPAHFAMHRNAGAYAWKPVLIKEMLDNHAAEVLWLDCGDRIVRPTALPKIFNVIRALGFVSESSVRTTKRWVHPLMLKYLGAEGLDVTNCNGALVGAARFHRHYADIVEPWVRCARVEACIAPPRVEIEQTQRQRRVDGVGRPKFDFHMYRHRRARTGGTTARTRPR